MPSNTELPDRAAVRSPHPRLARPYTLMAGWALCHDCGRQVKVTNAGLLPGHQRKGEHNGDPACLAGRTAP